MIRRRLIAAIAVGLLGLVPTVAEVALAPGATAHSTCSLNGGPSVTRSGGSVYFTGAYVCPSQVHAFISITVVGQRRTPGQGFVDIVSTFDSDSNSASAFAQPSVPWNCAKDYRTRATGDASPGAHHNANASSILFHTC